MGAKQKLNSIYTLGVLAVAALIGAMADSWLVFLIVAAVLWAAVTNSGEIRR